MSPLSRQLSPSRIGFAVTFLGSLLALILTSVDIIFDALSGENFDTEVGTSLADTASNEFDIFLKFFDGTGGSATLATLIFWAGAGAALYMLFWIIFRTGSDFFKNASIASSYTKGQSFDKTKHWADFGGRLVFKIVSGILLIVMGTLLYKSLFPLWQEIFQGSIVTLPELSAFIKIPLATLGLAACVHVLVILSRFVVGRVRLLGGQV